MMSEAKKRVPKRRFKEFFNAGDWEQCKLDELTISIGDGLHGTPKYDENGSYYFINGNNLVDSKVSVTAETKKVAFEALSNDDIRLDSTSILMSINGTMGTLARYNNENIMLGKSVAYITPKNINRDFLFYQLQGNVIQSYFYKNLTGTTIKNLGLGTIKNAIVMSTLSEEESKIGQFFYKLDQFITLHQRKLDKLQATKKALLKEMFPEEGQDKPKRRFKGFTGAWEQCKLGDLAEIVRGASPRPISDPKWFDNDSNVGWLRIADVTAQDGRIRYLEQKISELGQEKTRVIKTPHLLLSIAATVGKPVINYVPTGVHDGFLIFLNPKFNILYAFWWLEMFREKWNKYGQPGSQVNLNSDLVKNQVINIPNEKEQEKISSFLESLDKIITLHQRKLDKLKNLKQAYLNEMFV